jgi:hypothetical protein
MLKSGHKRLDILFGNRLDVLNQILSVLSMKAPISTIAALVCGAASVASAQVVFTENFDADHTANWAANSSGGNNAANFYFDYSSIGIPSAPNAAGTTRGLKLEANYSGGIFSGISVSPAGQSFSGSYKLSFDMWINFIGPAPGGGSGSTQVTGAGIGTAGTTAQWAGGTQDSIHFGVTGDGGSGVDYRAYSSAAGTGYTPATGVFAAGTSTTPDARNNSASYYAALGGYTPPAAQTALFPQQNGTTAAGAPAFAWHKVELLKNGNWVTYTIDNLLIATVDASAVTLGGGNILFNQYDINATSSTDANVRSLEFGLIDDVVVTQVPEPATCALGLLGLAGMWIARRNR